MCGYEPGGRSANPSLAPDRESEKEKLWVKARLAQEQFADAVSKSKEEKEIDLTKDFTKAASDDETERDDQGSSKGPRPTSESKVRRYRYRRNRDRDNDRGQ